MSDRSYLSNPNLTADPVPYSDPALAIDQTAQRLVLQGYKFCLRRTYFIRFIPKQARPPNFKAQSADACAAQFFSNGEIDLNQILPKDFLANLHNLYTEVNEEMTLPWGDHVGCHPACGQTTAGVGFAAMDVAFTYSGLEKLGIRQELLEVFRIKNPAFQENAYLRAQRTLGDHGFSDPQEWETLYQNEAGFDLVLTTHMAVDAPIENPYKKPTKLDTTKAQRIALEFEAKLQSCFFPTARPRASNQALTNPAWMEESCPIDFEGTVFFDLKDGITSPQYTLNPNAPSATNYITEHALGEVLLGQVRNDGSNPYADLHRHLRSYAPTRLGALTDDSGSRDIKALDFFRNSSFGVLRKMQQRADVFEDWLKAQAKKIVTSDAQWQGAVVEPADPYKITKAWIKAKMLGRKPLSGELLTPQTLAKDVFSQIDSTIPASEEGFHETDPSGLGCPFASHIRRMNPRDDPVVPFIARPLLRRGMPYGTAADTDKGLSGLFICSDIEQQFEHLIGTWANGKVLGVNDPSDCLDPLIGNHQRADTRLFINAKQGDDLKNYVTDFKQAFVITRGCAYIWFPAKTTLAKLGSYVADN